MNVKKRGIVSNPASKACSFSNFPLGNKKGAIKRVFLAVIVVGVIFLAGVLAVPPWDGSGNSADPYQITNCTQLQNMSLNLSSYFILTTDINCSNTSSWNSGQGFEPIGDSSTKFTGSFDGNNSIITDLFISRSSTSYVGLFGYINNANITNIGLIGVNIKGTLDEGITEGDHNEK